MPTQSSSTSPPCRHFRTIQDIANAVIATNQSEDTTESAVVPLDIAALLHCINRDKCSENDKSTSSTFCADPCPNRGNISLAILNAIRDACRPFLDEDCRGDGVGDQSMFQGRSCEQKANSVNERIRYEESFPQLSGQGKRRQHQKQGPCQELLNSSSHKQQALNDQTTKQQQRGAINSSGPKIKRRIRPATVHTKPNKQVPWTEQSPSFLSYDQSIPDPPPKASHLLERRFSKPEVAPLSSPRPTNAVSRSGVGDKQRTMHPESEQTLAVKRKLESQKPLQHPPVTDDITARPSLEILANLYNALIQASLVPSTALEIHLLLRLLTVSPKSTRGDGLENTNTVFASLFEHSGACILFASHVLTRQEQTLFGLGLTRSLVSCPPVELHCPNLIIKLLELEQETSNGDPVNKGIAGRGGPFRASSAVDQTALFTLPFDPARDSRHKFRSSDKQALFKNRESTRDAFLYQLRNFYNSKSVSHGGSSAKQMTQAQERQLVRTVLDDLQTDNFSWFAEFFRDLMLQLGSVPVVHETDEELLQMADSETLQKLHQRLFGASTTESKKISKKSSQSIVDSSAVPPHEKGRGGMSSRRDQGTSTSNREKQLRCFPGYQEFFFMFVTAADSYHFSRHLFIALTEKLKSAVQDAFTGSPHSVVDADHCIPRLRILSKFIGVLLFAPFWSSSDHPAQSHLNGGRTEDMLGWLTQSGISLSLLIRKAQTEQALVLMLPWIVDLLKMVQWVPHFASSVDSPSLFREVLMQLRTIQLWLTEQYPNKNVSIVNKSFLCSCLESLFRDSIGLVRTATLERDTETQSICDAGQQVEGCDHLEGIITQEMLLSADGYNEELADLIACLSRPMPQRMSRTSRKLRPLQLDSVAPAGPFTSPAHFDGKVDKKVDISPLDTAKSKSSVETNLRDTFFHQHRQVKEICDFAVNQTLRDLSEILEREYVKPIINQKMKQFDGSVEMAQFEAELFEAIYSFVRSLFQERLMGTLRMLAPAHCKEEVMQLACAISADRGCDNATMYIRSAIANGLSTLTISQNNEVKQKDAVTVTTSGDEPEQKADDLEDNHEVESLLRLSNQIESLADQIGGGNAQDRATLTLVKEATDTLDKYAVVESAEIVPHALLRRIYEGIVHLDTQVQSKVEPWLSEKSERNWALYMGLFSFAARLSHISRYGLPSLVQCILDPDISSDLMKLAETCGDLSGFAEILVKLVGARLVTFSSLMNSLPFPKLIEQVIRTGQILEPAIPWETYYLPSSPVHETFG